ncbi:MAG: urease accessory protein UreD [Acidobacteriota bacterium]
MLAPATFDISVDPSLAVAGAGELCVTRVNARSVVTRARATSPLKLLTPRNHGRAAWVFTSTYGGGLVDGDAIALDIEIGDGASALLSSQASTKVYRSPRGSSTLLLGRVGRGALLVVLPDPVVCFAGSSYRQSQQFDLASDSALVCLDWMTSGRRARGERWAFDAYRTRLAIRVDGDVVCYDAMTLDAADDALAERFGRFDVLATVAIVGRAFREPCDRLLAATATRAVERTADMLIAVAPLTDAGVLLRIAGRTVEDVGRVIRGALDFLPAVLGDDPWTRKW